MNAIPPLMRRHPRQQSTVFVQIGIAGACLDLLTPDWSPVTLTDIASSLARLPRFAGHTLGTYAYSVAQHSALCAAAVFGETGDRQLAAAALLHDGHESAIGDIPTPVKAALGAPSVRALEDRLQAALFARFGLDPQLARQSEVMLAELRALATERRDLLPDSAWPWNRSLPAPWPERIEPVPASRAHAQFLAMAVALGLHR